MKWDRDKIYSKVKESADRFGDRNPQQWKQLVFALSNSDPIEVWEGLYLVLCERVDTGFVRQELAGKLLYEINPCVEIDVLTCIKGCLESLDLSIEQLPWFLVSRYGKGEILRICDEIDEASLTDNEAKCLGTFKWWANRHRG